MVELTVNYNKVCEDCKDPKLIVLDQNAGDLICTGCGLVLEERCWDSSADWRNFKTDAVGSGQDITKERADIQSSYMEGEDFKAGTSIYGTGTMAKGLQRAMQMVDATSKQQTKTFEASGASSGGAAAAQGRRGAPRRAGVFPGDPAKREPAASAAGEGGVIVGAGASASSSAAPGSLVPSGLGLQYERSVETIIQAYTKKVKEIVSRMGIGDNVTQRCIGLLQLLADRNKLKMKKDRSWVCALVHLATVEESCTQMVVEIAQATAGGARARPALGGAGAAKPVKKEAFERGGQSTKSDALESSINVHVKELTNVLGLAKQKPIVEDLGVMQRLVRLLELSGQVAAPAQQIVTKAIKQNATLGLRINRIPNNALIAAAIFIVAWLLDVERKPQFHQVAAHARCTESHVKAAYKALHPKLQYLVPQTLRISLPGELGGLPRPS